jgi:hypothetical protein
MHEDAIMIQNHCQDCGAKIGRRSKRCFPCSVKARNQKGENNYHWQGGKTKCSCQICGKIFYVKPSKLKHGRGKYCSVGCRRKAQAQQMTGPGSPLYVERIEKTCLYCKKTIYVMPSGVRHSNFCDRKCMTLYTRGANHHGWMGGKSCEPYPPTFNKGFKRKIRDRDNHLCAVCGKKNATCVHHIDYCKETTIEGNCITLCGHCHQATNQHRAYWQRFFTLKMMDCLESLHTNASS